MLESHKKTKAYDRSEIVVYLSDDDETSGDAMNLIGGKWPYIVGPHRYYGEVMNYIATVISPNCDYYQEVNDDHVYITDGWDERMVKTIERQGGGWGIAHPNKRGSPTDFSPSAYMMSGNIVRAVGWFTLPGLRQNSIDNAIHKFGGAMGRIWYVSECIIEHRTWSASQRGYDLGVPRDSNADTVYSKDEEARGAKISDTWDYSADVKKVQEAMNKK